MLWQEKSDNNSFEVPEHIQDLAFRIQCRELPVDHAWKLSEAVCHALPWLSDIPDAAVHPIHGATSGNGWTRPPEQPSSLLHLSRRTRLYIRLPKSCFAAAGELEDQILSVNQFQIRVGPCQVKPLVASQTIFCRSLTGYPVEDEEQFTNQVVADLGRAGVNPKRMICGLSHSIATADGGIAARSVMLADLEFDESIRLQQQGLGSHRLIGCGIFLPHKSIAAVAGSPDT